MRQPASSLDLFTDSVRLMGDATVVSVIELDRRVHIARLEASLSRCLDAFPILTSQLVRDGQPAYWDPLGRRDGDDRIEVMELKEKDIRPACINPCHPYHAPQVRVRVLRTSTGDTVVLSMAHAAADGYGLKLLTRSLIEGYIGGIVPASADRGLPDRDTRWTERLLDGEETADELEIINPMWPAPCSPSRAPSTFHRAEVSPSDVERLRTVAHAQGGTLNDLLMSAYFLSLSDLTGFNGPLSLFFPVDLRRYLPPGSREMTNQAINIGFNMSRVQGEGITSMLGKVIQETRRMKSSGKMGIKEAVAFDRGCDPAGESMQRMVESMHALEKEGLADIFISNPGTLELPDLPGLNNAFICYPGGYMPTTCFVISVFRGRMTITMGYQAEDEPREATYRAMRGFLDHLTLNRTPIH